MASGESVNCEETEKELMKNVFYNEFGLQFVVKGEKKNFEFSNCISGKHSWQIKSNFLGVKHGKSNRLKKRENDFVN